MTFTEMLFIAGFAIALFFLFRNINLWYWRINDIVKNQSRQEGLLSDQNELLKKIFIQLGGQVEDISKQVIENYSSNLSDEDKKVIEDLRKNIKNDELIIRIKRNGSIVKWRKVDWVETVKGGKGNNFELIFSNET